MNVSTVRIRCFLQLLLATTVAASGATKMWDGRSANSLWSNPSNWVDNIAPLAGDSLVFPATNVIISYNDFPAGTVFDSLLIAGNYLSFDGNLIGLNAGIVTEGYISTVVTLPIRLHADQTFFLSSNFSATIDFRRGGIDVNGFELTFAGPGTCYLSSTISGSGTIIQRTLQPIYLWATNTFTGLLRVESSVIVRNLRALGDPAGPTELRPGAVMDVQATGEFDESLILGAESRVIRGVWNGPITLAGPNAQFVSVPAINGPVSGPGGIAVLSQSIVVTLNANNTYTGTNRVNTGTLIVNGHQPSSPVHIDSAGNLAGLGRVGAITCPSGQIRPGTDSIAILTCGDLHLGRYGALAPDVRGPVPGIGYDQLSVVGTVTLANSLLFLSNSFAAAPGDEFMILNNDGTDPITGIFGGLPEGITLAAGGVKFRISYVGGDGNDVVLTALEPALPPVGITRVWDGGGENDLWSTPENWVDDIAPSPGESLEFPQGAARFANVNDFPDGRTFDAIRLTGAGYHLRGAAVALSGGIVATHTSGVNEVSLPLRLNTNQAFISVTAPLYIHSAIDTVGSTLTVSHGDELRITGVITGAGGLIKGGPGTLLLSGANTYSGPTEITAGELVLTNDIVLGDSTYGTFIRSNSVLTLYGDITNEPLTLDGRLRSLSLGEVSTNRISSPMVLRTRAFLEISNVLVIDSHITGPGPLTKLGTGTLILNGTNTYGNGTVLSNGTIIVNGSVGRSPVYLAGGTLGGTGWVQYINGLASNGVVAPALDKAGVLTVSEARLTSFPYNSKLVIDLSGTRPGLDYDQLRVESFLAVERSSLDIRLGFVPQVGDKFVIIDNLTEYNFSDAFLGRRQGAVFMVGETQFQITYRGGDGNDVELMATQGLPLTRTWDGGGGANRFWSNPTNWHGDAAPTPGDTIVFPRGFVPPASTTSSNDFPAGTVFRRLIFDGPWVVFGEPMSLSSGILAYNSATVLVPLTLTTNQAFVCDAGIFAQDPLIDIRRGVDFAGHQLTFDGSGKFAVRAQLSSGTLLKAGTGRTELYSNNLHGVTLVQGGELVIHHTDALGGADHGTEVAPGAQLTLTFGRATILEPLRLGGTLAYYFMVLPATNRWAADVWLTDQATIITSNTFLFEGVVEGPGGLTKTGPGALMLAATNTYSGPTIVSNGIVFVHGSQPQSSILLRGGTLGGRGLAGPVVGTSGQVAPGNGPFQSSVHDVAILSCGDLTASSNTHFELILNGPTPGIGHDQLKVIGTLTLDRPRLRAAMRFAPELGEKVTLIDNDGTDAISGTFSGLPEGGFSVQSNMLFQISYVGGDGNDLTLTRVPAPASTLASINLQGGSMVLQGIGISNLVYTIESATNLNPPILWQPAGTASANRSNIYQFIHAPDPTLPMNFYRVRSP